MTPPGISILDACSDPALFERWFCDRATWSAWFTFLRVLFGLPLGEADRELFRRCTGRDELAADGYGEAWLAVGRRGGKSLVLALIAVFLALFRDWSPFLSPGERGTVIVVATDRRQARVIYRYAHAFISQVPMLAAMIERETAQAIDLDNGITVEILLRPFRKFSFARGASLHRASWRYGVAACRLLPAQPTGGSRRLSFARGASSPCARLWRLWRRGHTDQSRPPRGNQPNCPAKNYVAFRAPDLAK